jgi:hypothetical protein
VGKLLEEDIAEFDPNVVTLEADFAAGSFQTRVPVEFVRIVIQIGSYQFLTVVLDDHLPSPTDNADVVPFPDRSILCRFGRLHVVDGTGMLVIR